MHLYQNDEDDDDVSVLTFHTIGTREAIPSNYAGGSSSFVKSARENLEKLILESKNSGDGDDGKSLSRISEAEEGGSQMSSCHSKKGCDRSASSKQSSMKGEEKEKIDDEDDYADDDTISLAESILDSANKVLSNIYGRSKKQSSPTHTSPLPQPNQKHPSPMKQPTKMYDADDDDKEPKSIYNTKKEFATSKNTINDQNNQVEVSSNFLSSYFHDENTKPTTHQKKINSQDDQLKVSSSFSSSYFRDENTKPTHQKMVNSQDNQLEVPNTFLRSYFRDENSKPTANNLNHNGSITKVKYNKGDKVTNNDDYLQTLESERKHLHQLLKERQIETQRASHSLGSSIKKANELLERISADRTSR